mgnify:CR=1 FL=1
MTISFPAGAAAPPSISLPPLSSPAATVDGRAAGGAAAVNRGCHPRSRSAFDTTHTELNDMAAAAIIGFRFTPAKASAPAATGMHTAL